MYNASSHSISRESLLEIPRLFSSSDDRGFEYLLSMITLFLATVGHIYFEIYLASYTLPFRHTRSSKAYPFYFGIRTPFGRILYPGIQLSFTYILLVSSRSTVLLQTYTRKF
jgi:hypothetical protein